MQRRDLILGLLASSTLLPVRGLASPQTAPAARPDLYHCEGCEALGERDPETLAAERSLPEMPGEAMRLQGVVYHSDGITPAAGVVIYAHHTNADGLYADGGNESVWSRSHGRLRGWVRTAADGRYTFRSIKPAPYPGADIPAHVHLMVGEPARRPYYIDDVVFAGEAFVDERYLARQQNRGGSGVVTLQRDAANVWIARRDMVLERHPV